MKLPPTFLLIQVLRAATLYPKKKKKKNKKKKTTAMLCVQLFLVALREPTTKVFSLINWTTLKESKPPK